MRRFSIFAALLPALISASVAVADPVAPTGGRYVALGSSFAAGPNIATPAPSPAAEARCARSSANYAHLLAQARHFDLVDASCSGAKSVHLLGAWDSVPAQLDAVNADTLLVTVLIGGNDLNYVGNIAALVCSRHPSAGSACPAYQPVAGADELHLALNLRAIVQRIHTVAPAARVVFVQYFSLFGVAGNCRATGLADEQVAIVRRLAQRLAVITQGAATASGAAVLPLDKLSAAHGICAREAWVNGLSPDLTAHDGVPFHPNARGMAAAAAALGALLDTPPVHPSKPAA